MQDRSEYLLHAHRVTRQEPARVVAPKPRRAGPKLALIVASTLAAALVASDAKAETTVGVHVASGRAATPGAYIATSSGVTVGVLAPGMRRADAVVYAGVGGDVLRLGAARVGIEVGASHQRGEVGGYVAVSLRVGAVRVMWSPVTRAAGVAVEF